MAETPNGLVQVHRGGRDLDDVGPDQDAALHALDVMGRNGPAAPERTDDEHVALDAHAIGPVQGPHREDGDRGRSEKRAPVAPPATIPYARNPKTPAHSSTAAASVPYDTHEARPVKSRC
jgi:hypothetical protein